MSMDRTITVSRPDMVEALWNQVLPYLKPALAEDLFADEGFLKQLLLDDDALMFLAHVAGVLKGAAIVQIELTRKKIVNILCLGGEDFFQWKQPLNDALTEYARKMGCNIITAMGRRGWEKLWPEVVPSGKAMFYKEISA